MWQNPGVGVKSHPASERRGHWGFAVRRTFEGRPPGGGWAAEKVFGRGCGSLRRGRGPGASTVASSGGGVGASAGQFVSTVSAPDVGRALPYVANSKLALGPLVWAAGEEPCARCAR